MMWFSSGTLIRRMERLSVVTRYRAPTSLIVEQVNGKPINARECHVLTTGSEIEIGHYGQGLSTHSELS